MKPPTKPPTIGPHIFAVLRAELASISIVVVLSGVGALVVVTVGDAVVEGVPGEDVAGALVVVAGVLGPDVVVVVGTFVVVAADDVVAGSVVKGADDVAAVVVEGDSELVSCLMYCARDLE